MTSPKQNNQTVLGGITDQKIENYLSRGGSAGVCVWFNTLKEAKAFDEWLTKRRERLG